MNVEKLKIGHLNTKLRIKRSKTRSKTTNSNNKTHFSKFAKEIQLAGFEPVYPKRSCMIGKTPGTALPMPCGAKLSRPPYPLPLWIACFSHS